MPLILTCPRCLSAFNPDHVHTIAECCAAKQRKDLNDRATLQLADFDRDQRQRVIASLSAAAAELERRAKRIAGLEDQLATPIPMILRCPVCHLMHVDRGEWATKPHRTHLCGNCNHEWRPANVDTVGVVSL